MIPKEILQKIRQIEIRTDRLVSDSLAGHYHSVFKGQGMNFDEVREYQAGDDVRSIDWNVTARMNHPFIKKYVEERELTMMLMVDVSGSGLLGTGDRTKRELAAELASILAFSAIRNQDKVGLILFSDQIELFIPPRKGRRHVLRVIREILYHEPRQTGTNLAEAMHLLGRVARRHSIAILISDFLDPGQVEPGEPWTPETHRSLRQACKRHDLIAFQVLDELERELPDLGHVLLEDAETGEIVELNLGDSSSRERYAQNRTREIQAVCSAFRKLGADHLLLETGEDYVSPLTAFFRQREKRLRRGFR